MDVLHSCRCCLRGAPDKELTVPYRYLGKTEIYADMLKECFDFHIKLVDEASSGICWACVDRLRDACHFKLQVQRSEEELQKVLLVKVEPSVLPEMSDAGTREVTTVELSDDDPIENAEIDDRNEPQEMLDEDPLLQSEGEDDVMSISDSSEAAAAESELNQPAHAKEHAINTSARLERLRSDSRQSEGQPYACEDCDSAFENMALLTTHTQLTHSSSTQSKDEHLQKHQTTHNEKQHLECSTSLENQHFDGQKLLQCSYCEFKYNGKESLQRHLSIHTGEKCMYSCTYCYLKFSRKEEMKNHQKTHTGEQSFTCSYCDLEFSQESKLQSHLMIHTGEKSYTCNQCHHKFKTKYHLRRHEIIHSGEKPYNCTYCDLKFSRKDHLKKHLKRH